MNEWYASLPRSLARGTGPLALKYDAVLSKEVSKEW